MLLIRALNSADQVHLQNHLDRHLRESGANGIHFMPYDLEAGDKLQPIDFSALQKPLHAPGWKRWWIAVADNEIVGHLDLKGSALRSGLHRCLLGIGIDKAWRGRGVGRQLMAAAIDFARTAPELDWVDLGVFDNNPRAFNLYKALGFVEIGRREDCFRIGATSITDITMTLRVSAPASACTGHH